MRKVADKICLYCNKSFHPARKDRLFCSRECGVAYRKNQGGYIISDETKQRMSVSHTGLTYITNTKDSAKLFGLSSKYVIDKCLNSEFPGTEKWPADHPIWDCHIYGRVSPREAWKNKSYITQAVNNLFYITKKSMDENKYETFVRRIRKSFKDNDILLLREVLNRFTIAKIAPKVTALMPSAFHRILKESNIDISSGLYCPMAGFGGIIRGAEEYYKKNKINAEIEAYDINPILCKYYGWTERDVLAQHIKTDKVVFVCPPFGEKTERWTGTPDNMYYEFKEWVNLIKEHIDAPNYIFVGPELNVQDNRCGLFTKKYGIQYYPEYSK